MKIAFSIAHMGLGGAQRVTLNLIRWLQTNTSNQVLLIIESTIKRGDFAYPLDNIDYINLPDNKIKKIRTLRKVIQKENPDVIITMGLPNTVFDTPACVGLRIKHIVSERNDPRNFPGHWSTKFLSRLFARYADGYVFQTQDAKEYYNRDCFSNGAIIPNPLLGIENMPSEVFCGVRDKEIVTVGRLNKQKNHPLLIKAFAEVVNVYPEYKLIIYGEGPEEPELQSLISDLNINDKVILAGSTQNVFEKIYKSSLFVLSSDFEGMPNALIEAMALGVPCISTDCPCGGPKDLINNWKSGVLIPVGDKISLVNAMIKVLENKEVSAVLSNNAFKIRHILNADIIGKKWLNYINSVVNQS